MLFARPGRTRFSSLGIAFAIAAAGVFQIPGLACQGAVSDPLHREAVVLFDARALERFAERSARLANTPLASAARRMVEVAAECDTVWAHPLANEDGELDFPELGCLADARATTPTTASVLSLAEQRRGEADGLLTWPLGDAGHIELRFDVDAHGGFEVDGAMRGLDEEGFLALFVPGEEAPAAPVIEPSRTLVHLRMRPAGGVALSSLIPEGSQGDRLFALKGRLLEGALLAGTWELAFVPPTDGASIPLVVGALHHRHAAPIERALDEALDQLEATWPIQRTPRHFVDRSGRAIEGGCFLELPLLPELAPCWVVTDRAFVMGYRAAAVEAALAAPAVSSGPAQSRSSSSAGPPEALRSGVQVHFDRIGQVDRRLAPEEDRVRPDDLWERFDVELDAGERGGEVHVTARLEARQ